MNTLCKSLFISLMICVTLVVGGKTGAVMYGTPTNPIYDRVLSLHMEFPKAAITSWCRSKEYNRTVGGVEGSRHITCMAVDMVVPDYQVKSFVRRAKDLGFWVLIESDHIHLEERTRK